MADVYRIQNNADFPRAPAYGATDILGSGEFLYVTIEEEQAEALAASQWAVAKRTGGGTVTGSAYMLTSRADVAGGFASVTGAAGFEKVALLHNVANASPAQLATVGPIADAIAARGYAAPTIASLLADTPNEIRVARVLGYEVAGSGGAGNWRRVASEPTHLAKRPAAGGEWWELADNVVELDSLGAVGGDAEKDTAAWLEAVSTGRPIKLGLRTYHLLATAAIARNVRVFGEDRNLSRIRWMDATGSNSLFLFEGARIDARFSTMTIDSGRQGHTDTSSYFAAIDFAGTTGSRLLLDDVDFVNGRILDVRVRGPKVFGEMITFDCRGCTFANGLMGTASRAAVYVQAQENVDVHLHDNRMSMPRLPNADECGRAGFVIQRNPVAPFLSSGSATAVNNSFFNVGRGRINTLGCIDVYSGAEKVIIAYNRADHVPGRAFSVKGDQSNIIIIGNIVTDVLYQFSVAIALFQDLFNARTDRNAIIVYNEVEGADCDAIFIDGKSTPNAADGGVEDPLTRFRRVLVQGNILTDIGRAATTYSDPGRAILVRFVNEEVIVRGNVVNGAIYGVSALDISGVFACDDNFLRNCGRVLGPYPTGGPVAVSALTSTSEMEVFIRRNVMRGTINRNISIQSEVKLYVIEDNDINSGAVAYYTFGSTEFSVIRRNIVRAVTLGLWSKGGVDASVAFKDNIGTLSLAFAVRNLAVPAGSTTGSITAFTDWHYVGVTGATGPVTITRINGLEEGDTLVLSLASYLSPVTLSEGDNIHLQGSGVSSFQLNHSSDGIFLQKRNGNFYEISSRDNG